MRDAHRDAWFCIVGCDSVAAPRLGAMPRGPFGDVLFLYLVAGQLGAAGERLAASGIERVPL
eukprot:8137679-Lingulodinium_polyedra.AAC.1